VIQPGSFVRFVPVEPAEFIHIRAEVETGAYRVTAVEVAE
jgi:allophanate hydrolase subunit 1